MARLISVGLSWVLLMWIFWGLTIPGAWRTGRTVYYGILYALQRNEWIEPDQQVPMRPIEWLVRGPLELGPGFGWTVVCTVVITGCAVVWLWWTMPSTHASR